MVDYKINDIRRDGTTTTVNITVYRGTISTQDEIIPGTIPPTIGPVTRYRRNIKVGTFERTLDRDVTEEQVRARLNEFLATRAALLGETVITEQV